MWEQMKTTKMKKTRIEILSLCLSSSMKTFYGVIYTIERD